MVGQTIVTLLLLSATTLAPSPGTVQRGAGNQTPAVMAAAGAPARMSLGGLDFSEHVDKHARPDDASVEFNKNADRVWVSFDYSDFNGDLDCCDGEMARWLGSHASMP